MRPEVLQLTRDTVGPIARGHPWVWRDGVASDGPLPSPGTPVRLLDARKRPVAFGLVDEGDIAVRVLSRYPAPVPEVIARCVDTAAALRAAVVPDDTDAYRLINGAGDGLPGLVVDRYADLLVVRIYGACWVPWLDAVVATLRTLPGVEHIVRRLGVRRVDGAEGLTTLHGPGAPEKLVIREAGLRFLVRPDAGQKTGLFLDQRENRRLVGRVSRDRDVIDVFCNVGGFAVHAAAAGARRVTVVDIAEDAVADVRENLSLNGIDPDRHAFVVADAFQWEPDAPADVVICDPPNLSHGRGADKVAWAQYRDLATRYGRATAPGGLLATASCTARLSWERWEQAVRDGLRKAGRWSWLHRAAEPPDHPVLAEHPEARYLKLAMLQRRPDSARG